MLEIFVLNPLYCLDLLLVYVDCLDSHQFWTIFQVLSVSGYVFCYACIKNYVLHEKKCPVTTLPADLNNLIRIFPLISWFCGCADIVLAYVLEKAKLSVEVAILVDSFWDSYVPTQLDTFEEPGISKTFRHFF